LTASTYRATSSLDLLLGLPIVFVKFLAARIAEKTSIWRTARIGCDSKTLSARRTILHLSRQWSGTLVEQSTGKIIFIFVAVKMTLAALEFLAGLYFVDGVLFLFSLFVGSSSGCSPASRGKLAARRSNYWLLFLFLFLICLTI